MHYTLVSKARLLLSFSPKYCAEALRLSLSWDVNLGGGVGCALRFRWAPQDSGSCTDQQAVICISPPQKISHTKRLFFLSTLRAVVTSDVSPDWSIPTVSLQLFSLACFSLRYSLYKPDKKTKSLSPGILLVIHIL